MRIAFAAFLAIGGSASGELAYSAETTLATGAPVTVTATRIHDLVGARVITAQDIERSRASSVSQLLQSLPEIRTRELQGSPNPLIDMRGFGSYGDQNTLVLLDGVRLREYEQLSVNWSAIPLESIERIEILPAIGAVLHGGGAIGGVINIVTRPLRPHSRTAHLSAGAASHDTRELRAGGSIAGTNVGLRAHVSRYDTDNYRRNSGVRIDNRQADLLWADGTSSLALRAGADDQRNGLAGVISEAQIAANRRQAARLQDFATQDGGWLNLLGRTKVGAADAALNLSYRERSTAAAFLVGTPIRNNVDTDVTVWAVAPRLRFSPQFGGWHNDVIVGADIEDWRFDATAGPTIVSQPHSTQRSTALYAQHAMRFAGRTTLSLGARAQRAHYDVVDRVRPGASGERNHALYAWDVSLRQALAPDASVYIRRGNSFRLPNVNDNYNPVLATVTLLEPQTAREWEAGLEGDMGRVRYRASVYSIRMRNEIFFDPVTLGSRNRQPTRRNALELHASWQAHPAVRLHANYVYAAATFTEGAVRGRPIAGNRVPLVPRHTLRAGLQWSPSSAWRADFDVRYLGSSAFDADEPATFGRAIPAYTVADLRLSWRGNGWLVNAGVRNLFDKEYLSYGVFTGGPTYSAVPAPERTMFVSAQYTFH